VKRKENSLSPLAVKCVLGVCLTVKPLLLLYASRRLMRGPEVLIFSFSTGAVSAVSPSTAIPVARKGQYKYGKEVGEIAP
jgi:hypothetical protein